MRYHIRSSRISKADPLYEELFRRWQISFLTMFDGVAIQCHTALNYVP